MKESWLYYDYLRRRWWLLLLGPVLGALAGLVYYSTQVHSNQYPVTASVAIPDSKAHAAGPEPLARAVVKMVKNSNITAGLRELLVDQKVVYAPPAGTYDAPVSITIISQWPRAEIRYMIQPGESRPPYPTANMLTVYSEPILLTETSTIHSVAVVANQITEMKCETFYIR